jgi:C4-dicarboxylate-specific signal transduction histidine kinase
MHGCLRRLSCGRVHKSRESLKCDRTLIRNRVHDVKNAVEGTPPELSEQLMRIARVSALEEMASGFAHEVNQSLGAISTFASVGERLLQKEGQATSNVIDVLRQIRDEAMHGGDSIRRIRRLFQPHDERKPCLIPELIDELRPVIESSAMRAGLTPRIVYQPRVPAVNVDGLRIQHVLRMLVQNALEATPSHRDGDADVCIEVSATRYDVEVAVTDRGNGIAVEQREQIFRPFFTTKSRGTGLGLASSRATIEAYEGSIGFADVEGGGTRFWFRLPIAEEH